MMKQVARNYLINEWVIRWRSMFLVYLWAAFLSTPTRNSLLKQSSRCMRDGCANRTKLSICVYSYPYLHDCKICSPRKESLIGSRCANEQELSDLGLTPQLALIPRIYRFLSNALYIIVLLEMILLLFLDTSNKLPVTNYLRCYGPIILIPHQLIDVLGPALNLALAMTHLIWRAIIYLGGEFDLNIIQFLLAKDDILLERIKDGTRPIRSSNTELDILNRCLFYEFKNGFTGQTNFKLRPNRTLESRKKLIELIKINFNSMVIGAYFSVLGISSLGIYTLTFNQDSLYTDCRLQVDKYPGYIIRWIILVPTNMMFSFDLLCGAYFVGSLGYILVYDLTEYWHEICHRVRFLRKKIFEQFHKPKSTNLMPTGGRFSDKSDNNDQDIVELQFLLANFFNQLKKVDKFMTKLIANTLGIWLLMNSVLTQSNLQLSLEATPEKALVRFLQILGLIMVIGLCAPILNFKKEVESVYPILCQIVAMDKTIRKKEWLSLIDTYTTKPHYSFTILHGPIFSHAICIRILSYTLTLVFLLESHRLTRYYSNSTS